jgi:hypothetical protein
VGVSSILQQKRSYQPNSQTCLNFSCVSLPFKIKHEFRVLILFHLILTYVVHSCNSKQHIPNYKRLLCWDTTLNYVCKFHLSSSIAFSDLGIIRHYIRYIAGKESLSTPRFDKGCHIVMDSRLYVRRALKNMEFFSQSTRSDYYPHTQINAAYITDA